MNRKHLTKTLKKHADTAAIICIVAGVLLFAASFTLHIKNNILLFAALLCVVAGTAGYVWSLSQTNRHWE